MALDKDFAEKWIAALQSGKYQKGVGSLCKKGYKKLQWCCLGVACDLDHDVVRTRFVQFGRVYNFYDRGDNRDNRVDDYLPTNFANKIGLSRNDQEILADINDRFDTFEPVIDHIKKMLADEELREKGELI